MADELDQPARPVPRIISTADALRALPYRSPAPGWHSHGQHLVPTDGCAACAELHRRLAEPGPAV